MKTITAEFVYNGKTYTLKAKLTDNMKLSKSKDNMATEIIEDGQDGRWSLFFEDFNKDFHVELVMYLDSDDNSKWHEADYAILWSRQSDCILADVDITKQRVQFR